VTEPSQRRLSAGAVINLGLIIGGLVLIVGLLVMRLLPGDEGNEPIELALQLQQSAEGFDSPVLLTGAGDGSTDRYVVEQRGRIMRLGSEGGVDEAPLLDITDRVLHHHERGLLGLAFHPAFEENGRFFVAYSRREDGATAISEFTLPGALDVPVDQEEPAETPTVESTERQLLVIAQPHTTHKGGMLAFDHDGMLLISTGDGGSSDDPHDNGLDAASLLGKLLRIDVDRGWPYAIPGNNGFIDDRSARPEVHAIGLRDPWRFSVDRDSGDIYIADVGQHEWEEINILRRGQVRVSFGWSDMEGRGCFDDRDCDPGAHTLPAVAYPHVEGDTEHCSIIGGYAYRGAAGSLPDGTYLYADHCSGTIWGVAADQLLTDTAAPAVVGHLDSGSGQVQAFGEDDAGELYLLTDGGFVFHIAAADDRA